MHVNWADAGTHLCESWLQTPRGAVVTVRLVGVGNVAIFAANPTKQRNC